MPGELHGQRSLAGYSPCGHKESDTTEQLTLHWESRYEFLSQEGKFVTVWGDDVN